MDQTLRLPKRRKLHRDDFLVGRMSLEDADVARESSHVRDEVAGDRGMVIGQVAPHELDDELCLAWRKELAAHFESEADILLQRLVRLDDRAHRGACGLRR